jgi:hypothetical protein
MNQGDCLAPPAAINTKIIDVGGDDRTTRVQFAQTNQAKIGQVGFAIGITRREFRQARKMLVNVKRWSHQTVGLERQSRRAASEVECRFRNTASQVNRGSAIPCAIPRAHWWCTSRRFQNATRNPVSAMAFTCGKSPCGFTHLLPNVAPAWPGGSQAAGQSSMFLNNDISQLLRPGPSQAIIAGFVSEIRVL